MVSAGRENSRPRHSAWLIWERDASDFHSKLSLNRPFVRFPKKKGYGSHHNPMFFLARHTGRNWALLGKHAFAQTSLHKELR
jgi:hypothetical protein